MNILQKLLISILAMLSITACTTPYTSVRGEVVHLRQDTILNSNTVGIRYVVHENVTLNLNGYIMSGSVGNHQRLESLIILTGDNATVKNGSLVDAIWGVSLVTPSMQATLNALAQPGITKKDARALGVTARLNSYSGQTVSNVNIEGMSKGGAYVQAFNTSVDIVDCSFHDIGYTGIYVDHGTANVLIDGNVFQSIGYSARLGKEAIALDGAVDALVTNNWFKGGAKRGYINSYTNWGENGIVREISTGHTISGNTFQDGIRGVSLASRWQREAAGKTALDYTTDTHVYDNTFINVDIPVEDFGNDNKIYDNEIM